MNDSSAAGQKRLLSLHRVSELISVLSSGTVLLAFLVVLFSLVVAMQFADRSARAQALAEKAGNEALVVEQSASLIHRLFATSVRADLAAMLNLRRELSLLLETGHGLDDLAVQSRLKLSALSEEVLKVAELYVEGDVAGARLAMARIEQELDQLRVVFAEQHAEAHVLAEAAGARLDEMIRFALWLAIVVFVLLLLVILGAWLAYRRLVGLPVRKILERIDHILRRDPDKKRLPVNSSLVSMSNVMDALNLLDAHENQRREALIGLKRLAEFDFLTGLPNRVTLTDRLKEALRRSRKNRSKVAVIFIDLDEFKEINDAHGHPVGDRVLASVSANMAAALRRMDTLSRIGGDEFVAVLPNLGAEDDARLIIDRIFNALTRSVEVDGLVLRVFGSGGVAVFDPSSPEEQREPDQLIRCADHAMYQAKLSGKNQYRFYDSETERSRRERESIVSEVRAALKRNEIVLFYQPKVDMRRCKVVGVEALVRWQHPERGLIPPGLFLPALDGHEAMVELGEWVINEALAQIQRWRALGLEIKVAVNLDAMQLQDRRFMDKLHASLAQSGAPGHCLEFEVVETQALADLETVKRIIADCKALNIHFALDDFGTGYSSLAYLKRLSGVTVKVDQSFVRDMLEDPDDLAILLGVLGISKAFGRAVIAEGIETERHGLVLLAFGCELGQGYVIARPMPGESIPQWISNWSGFASWRRAGLASPVLRDALLAAAAHGAWLMALRTALERGSAISPACPGLECDVFRRVEEELGVTSAPDGESLLSLYSQFHQSCEQMLGWSASGNSARILAETEALKKLNLAIFDRLCQLCARTGEESDT